MNKRFALVAWMGAIAVARSSAASCDTPEAKLLWSYPQAGDDDVPPEAVFWALPTTWVVSMTVDDTELEPFAEIDWSRGFETRSQPDMPKAITEDSVAIEGVWATRDEETFSSFCRDVINAQDCYDDGEDTHVVIELGETPGVETVAYLVTMRRENRTATASRALWPVECGSPSIFVPRSITACFQVRAVASEGHVAETEEFCVPVSELPEDRDAAWSPPGDSRLDAGEANMSDDSEPSRGSRSGWCSIGASGEGSPLPPSLVGVLLAMRRRRYGTRQRG